MRVSARHAFVAAAAAGAFLLVTPQASGGGGGDYGGGHCKRCQHGGGSTPRITIHGPRINVNTRVNTNVNVSNNNYNNVVVNVDGGGGGGGGGRGGGFGAASANAFAFAGGGGGGGGVAPAGSAITGLSVAGLVAYELVEEERTRIIEEWRVIRAVCIDARGTPHPASRPDPDERVESYFDGELFRCMAGTRMQVTIGWREDGRDRWDDAYTMMCEQGEALRHQPGGGVLCARETPQRNCNERSLLRMYGPGLRLVHLRREERYTEIVRHERRVAETTNMTLMLDGGVGGYR